MRKNLLKYINSKRPPQLSRTRLSVKIAAAAIGASLASGCAVDPNGQPSFKETFASDDPCSNNARNIGIGVGALAGVIIGNQFQHSNKARVLGAALGAAAGGLIGHDMDKRRCELAKIARQYDLDMKMSTIGADGEVFDDAGLKGSQNGAEIQKNAIGLSVEVRDQSEAGGHFETNSDQLTARAQQYFSAIADSYNARITANQIADPKKRAEYVAQIAKRKILLVGHTDDTGSSRLNADLSERRAKAVSKYMEIRGIPKESLYFQGAGEAYPLADNRSEEGRAKNRRVEIVEIADAASFEKYLETRKPRYDFYRIKDGERAPPEPGRAERTAVAAPAGAAPNPGTAAKTVATKKKTPAASKNASAALAANSAPGGASTARPAAHEIDFGGVPMAQSAALADVGRIAPSGASFSLISTAYASEPAVMSDCTRDRPRIAHGVRALSDGKVYRTSEHVPGLYGKTWTDQVNGHQIVMNKVAVLASDGSLANLPEFKIYANYDPAKNRNPTPDLSVSPEVNAYLGSKGVLYRMFLNGREGVECVDVVFAREGGAQAKAGKVVYAHAAKPYAAAFKPRIYQK